MLSQHAEKERVAALQRPGAAPPAPSGIGTRFQHADVDVSGGLSREKVAARLLQLADKVDEIDTNRDGRITIQELQSYWQRQPTTPARNRGAAARSVVGCFRVAFATFLCVSMCASALKNQAIYVNIRVETASTGIRL